MGTVREDEFRSGSGRYRVSPVRTPSDGPGKPKKLQALPTTFQQFLVFIQVYLFEYINIYF